MDGRDDYPDGGQQPSWYAGEHGYGVPRWRDAAADGRYGGDAVPRLPESPAGASEQDPGLPGSRGGDGELGAAGGYSGGGGTAGGGGYPVDPPFAAESDPALLFNADRPAGGRRQVEQPYPEGLSGAEAPSTRSGSSGGLRVVGGTRAASDAARPGFGAYPLVSPTRPDGSAPGGGADPVEGSASISPISSRPWDRAERTSGERRAAERTVTELSRPSAEPVDRRVAGPGDRSSTFPEERSPTFQPERETYPGERETYPADREAPSRDRERDREAPSPDPTSPWAEEPGSPWAKERSPSWAGEKTAPGRPVGSTAPVGDGVYRTSRPLVAVLFAVLVVVLEVPALRVFVDGAFGGPVVPGGVISGTLLMLGLPIFAIGLHGLVSGAASLAGPAGWLRPPLAHLPVGLLLLIGAALAA